MSKIDLHIHTSYSPDADFCIEKIIDIAEKSCMEKISFTDHNTIEAHKELVSKNIKTNIEIITGIELDCSFNCKNFHLLGYNIDINSDDFDNWLNVFTKREMDAVPERISKLQSLGFIIDKNEVYQRAGDSIPQEELMAEIILENKDNHNHPKLTPYMKNGSRSDMPLINFFWDFFSQGKPIHIPVEYLNINDAISMIKDNGGIPILAHPGANFKNDIEFVKKIMNHGIEGIEAISSYHTPELTELFLDLTNKEKYLISCGSDFHGKNKPLIKIGDFDCKDEQLILKEIKENF
ncbi:MAG: PHP domain-containing protein [bacterium]|nr:PHP domain-containing protein [bacterium]